jgi:hypothetical protein
MQLSKYSLERLRDDGEFILSRAHGEANRAAFRFAARPSFHSARPRDIQEARP